MITATLAFLDSACGTDGDQKPETAEPKPDSTVSKPKPQLSAKTNRFFIPDSTATYLFATAENPTKKFSTSINLELKANFPARNIEEMQKEIYAIAWAEGGDILGMRLTNMRGVFKSWMEARVFLTLEGYYRVLRNSVEGGPVPVNFYFGFDGTWYQITFPADQILIDSNSIGTELIQTTERYNISGTPVPVTDMLYTQMDIPLPVSRRSGREILSYFYFRAKDGAKLLKEGTGEPAAISGPVPEMLAKIGVTPETKFKSVTVNPPGK